jgi:hypothetical protein
VAVITLTLEDRSNLSHTHTHIYIYTKGDVKLDPIYHHGLVKFKYDSECGLSEFFKLWLWGNCSLKFP